MQRLIFQPVKILAALILAGTALHSPARAQEATKPMTNEEYRALAQSIDYEKHTVTDVEFLKLRSEGAVVLDLRDLQDYQDSHIEGALHIGSAGITSERLAQLVPDKNQTILIYCTNSFTPTRMMALTDLALPQFIALGYFNVFMPPNTTPNTIMDGLYPAYDGHALQMTGE